MTQPTVLTDEQIAALAEQAGMIAHAGAPVMWTCEGKDLQRFARAIERAVLASAAAHGAEACETEQDCTRMPACRIEGHCREAVDAALGVSAAPEVIGYVHKDWTPKNGQGRIYGHKPGPDYKAVALAHGVREDGGRQCEYALGVCTRPECASQCQAKVAAAGVKEAPDA